MSLPTKRSGTDGQLRATHCLSSIKCCLLLWAVVVGGGVRQVGAQRELRLPYPINYTNDDDNNNAIHTEFVDKNNLTVLSMFNLTKADVERKIAIANANAIANGNANGNVNVNVNADIGSSNSNDNKTSNNTEYFDKLKEYRLDDIKYRLGSMLNGSNSEESQDPLLHEMAAYPICDRDRNESSWLADNNVTIHFADSLFEAKSDQLSLDSAILRLYKLNPNARNQSDGSGADGADATDDTSDGSTKSKRCGDDGSAEEAFLDSQVRVTVSIVQQVRRNKRERKKRICNTIMLGMSKTGWVEIDIKRAIHIWENIEQQQQQHQLRAQSAHQGRHLVGWLMIEVHDEEERPLKAGLFFSPPKCDEADLAIPWNYYGPHAALSTSAAEQVPRCPRLDVTLTGYATWAAPQIRSDKNNDNNIYSNHLLNKLPRSIQQHQQLMERINAIGSGGGGGGGVNNNNSPLIAALRPLHDEKTRHHYTQSAPQEQQQ